MVMDHGELKNVKQNKYEVVPGLWIGSEIGDLYRERQILMSKLISGDDTAKKRIKEITDKLIEMKMGKFNKG